MRIKTGGIYRKRVESGRLFSVFLVLFVVKNRELTTKGTKNTKIHKKQNRQFDSVYGTAAGSLMLS